MLKPKVLKHCQGKSQKILTASEQYLTRKVKKNTILDIFLIKSTDFDTKLIKRSILIDLLSIIQSKTVDLYRKLIELWSNMNQNY